MVKRTGYEEMLEEALVEARRGLAEGGVPVGAAIFDAAGYLVGRGRNRRVQEGDPSMHAAVNAFKNAGRQQCCRNTVLVLTQAPCWYCAGLIRQFGFAEVAVGDVDCFKAPLDWLKRAKIKVTDLKSPECIDLMRRFKSAAPGLWKEDLGGL